MDFGLELLESFACGIIGNELFFYTFPDCNLMKMCLETGEIGWISNHHNIDDIPNYMTVSSTKVFRCGNNGNILSCYDVNRKTEYLLEMNVKDGIGTNILNIYSFQNSVIIVPKHEHEIIIYDEIEKKFIEKRYYDIVEDFQLSNCTKEDNKIWIWGKDKGTVVIYEIETMEFRKIVLTETLQIKYMSEKEGDIVFLTNDNDIYGYNIETEDISLVWKCTNTLMDFDRIHLVGKDFKSIILLPSINYNEILILENGKTKIYDAYPNDFEYIFPQQHKYIRYAETDDEYIYPMRATNYCLRLNKCDGTIDWVQPRISKDTIYKYFVESRVLKETKISSLEGFLKIL